MKQHKHTLNEISAKLLAYLIGAAIVIAAGSFYYETSSSTARSRQISGYNVECSSSIPAILPGMMNGIINVEYSN